MSSDCFHDLVELLHAMKTTRSDRRKRPQLVVNAKIIERTNDLDFDWRDVERVVHVRRTGSDGGVWSVKNLIRFLDDAVREGSG